ncbi:MAG: 4Fe-4S binding protein [candidate division WOR-3 bacterium]
MPKIELRKEWCKGCCLCLEICPKAVFDRESKISTRGFREIVVKNPKNCTGCRLCEMLCPDLAITVSKTNRLSEIKHEE